MWKVVGLCVAAVLVGLVIVTAAVAGPWQLNQTLVNPLKDSLLSDTPPTPMPPHTLYPSSTAYPTTRPMRMSASTPTPSDRQKTAEPRSSNATPQDRLERVDCRDCQWDYEPAITTVKWLNNPSVTADGMLTVTAQLNESTRLILPGSRGGGASNIVLTDGGTRMYGVVLPPARGGWNWNPEPGQWIAQT